MAEVAEVSENDRNQEPYPEPRHQFVHPPYACYVERQRISYTSVAPSSKCTVYSGLVCACPTGRGTSTSFAPSFCNPFNICSRLCPMMRRFLKYSTCVIRALVTTPSCPGRKYPAADTLAHEDTRTFFSGLLLIASRQAKKLSRASQQAAR